MAASGLRPPPPSWGQPGGCGAGPERARPQPLDVHGPPARRGCCAERQRMLGKKQTDKPARRGPGLGCQPDGEHHMQARGYRWLVAPGADVAGPECLLSLVAVQGPWGGSGWPATECVTGEGSQGQVSGHRCLPWSSGEGNRWAALLGGGVRVRLNGALGGQLSHAIPTALDTGSVVMCPAGRWGGVLWCLLGRRDGSSVSLPLGPHPRNITTSGSIPGVRVLGKHKPRGWGWRGLEWRGGGKSR